MKRIITLSIMMVLSSVLAIGQNTEFETYETYLQSKSKVDGLNADNSNIENFYLNNGKTHSKRSILWSTQDTYQRMDSLVCENWDESTSQWVNDLKYEFSYNIDGCTILDIEYDWDEINGQWLGVYYLELDYDAEGRLTQSLFSIWDAISNQWIYISKSEREYDVNGQLTQELRYSWDNDINLWVYYKKHEYTFDENGHTILHLEYEWDENNSQWLDHYKTEFTYDSSENLSTIINSLWHQSESEWVYNDMAEYEYDDDGNQTQFLSYNWYGSEEWVYNLKHEYEYSEDGQMTQKISSYWNYDYSQWYYISKNEYDYDLDGNVIQVIGFEWDLSINDWGENYRWDYEYNESGDPTQLIQFNWLGEWVYYSKRESIFNENYSASELILPYGDWGNNHMLTNRDYYSWDLTANNWLFFSTNTYYYSEQEISSIAELNGGSIKIYPNPASQFIKIETENVLINNIRIYNHLGQTMPLSANPIIDVSGFPKGMYVVEIDIEDKLYRKKLLVQ